MEQPPKGLETLIRVDERTQAIQKSLYDLSISVKEIDEKHQNQISNLKDKTKESMEKFRDEIHENFVTKESFSPIQKIVYSLAGTILTGVITAILALVIKGGVLH